MGLDMYLSMKTYVGNKYRKVSEQVKVIVPKKQDNATFPTGKIKQERISEIVEEVGYWRKANQIHNWFVQNVQGGNDDCKEYLVDEKELAELLRICKDIKEKCPLVAGAVTNGYTFENGVKMPCIKEGFEMSNSDYAANLLPVRPGFFFGGTDYDQYYMNDIDTTIEIIETLFAERGEKEYLSGDIYYSSSW